MINTIEVLQNYKNLKITRKQLRNILGKNFTNAKLEEGDEVVVDNNDLIFVLQATKEGRISVPDLVDWVNVIWFSGLYDYSEKYSASMASVMAELEELDEYDYTLPPEQIDQYIAVLEKNEEYIER